MSVVAILHQVKRQTAECPSRAGYRNGMSVVAILHQVTEVGTDRGGRRCGFAGDILPESLTWT
jgi:hypothetical protein